MQQIIAHIDMDCFFCSCEEKIKPEYKGNPVIVGGTGTRGVVSAANYEARRYDVYSATPIGLARKLCPDGIYLPVNYSLYKQESQNIMQIFSKLTKNMLQVSIDEAYLDLTELFKQFSNLESMARYIKNQVKIETGLTCSVGVAESKIVAKIASDFNKPDGVTIVKDAKTFLAPLSIGKIPGVGKKSLENYEDRQIFTIEDLGNQRQSRIFEIFGSQGVFYHRVANGLDFSKIEPRGVMKSLSRENTLIKDTSNLFELEEEIKGISKQLKKDLKDNFFKTVSIKLRYSDFTTLTRDVTLKTPMSSLKIIKNEALELFRATITSQQKVRLIGVKLANLSDENVKQKTLKEDEN